MLLDEFIEILQEERKTKGNVLVIGTGGDEPKPETIKGILYVDGIREEFECEDCCNDCEYIEAIKDIRVSIQGL